jgi:hypothetical protein
MLLRRGPAALIPCRRRSYCLQVIRAIEHGNHEGEGGHKADSERADESSRHYLSCVLALLRQVQRTVYARIHVIGRDQAGEEGHSSRAPSAAIEKGRPYTLCWLVVGSGAGHTGDCNGKEAG